MEYKIHKMENGLHRISMQSETIKLNCEGVTMEQAARIMQVFEGDAVKVTLREIKDNLAMSAEEFIDALSFRYSSNLDAETLAKAEKNYDVIMAAVDFLASRKG